MYFQKCNLHSWFSIKLNLWILLVTSIIGLFAGILISQCNSFLFQQIDYHSFFAKPSIFFLSITNLLPLIIIYYLMKFSLDTICYLIIFLLSISYGYCGVGLYHLFGDGTWLIRVFVFFSRSIAAIIYWLFLVRNFRRKQTDMLKDVHIFIFIILLFTAFDVIFVAPFIANFYLTI